jgi:hypothetical protein
VNHQGAVERQVPSRYTAEVFPRQPSRSRAATIRAWPETVSRCPPRADAAACDSHRASVRRENRERAYGRLLVISTLRENPPTLATITQPTGPATLRITLHSACARCAVCFLWITQVLAIFASSPSPRAER